MLRHLSEFGILSKGPQQNVVRGKQARDRLQVTEARQGLFQAAMEMLHQEPEREGQACIYSRGQRSKPCLTGQPREVKARHDLVARQVPCNILQDVTAEQMGSTMIWTWKIRLGWTFYPWEFPLGSGKKNHDTTTCKAEQAHVYLYCRPGLFLCLGCHFCFLPLIRVSLLTISTVVHNGAAPSFGKGEVHAGHSTEEVNGHLVGAVI